MDELTFTEYKGDMPSESLMTEGKKVKKEDFYAKHFPDFYQFLLSNMPYESFQEKLYRFYHPDAVNKCAYCGKVTKFRSFREGYNKYCSPGCTSKDKTIKEQKIQTLQSHYGVSNPSLSSDIQQKKKDTCLKKYGVNHYSKTSDWKQRVRDTCIDKYGVTSASKTDKVKQKTKDTNRQRYGRDFFLADKQITQRITSTLIQKYGGRGGASKRLLDKQRHTLLNNWGVTNPSLSRDIQAKKEQNCLEKYGVKYDIQRQEVQEKIKNTCLEVYGVSKPFESEYIRKKGKETILKKWGVDNPFSNKDIQEKIKVKNLELYGYEKASKNESIKQKTRQTNIERYGVPFTSQRPEYKTHIHRLNIQKYITSSDEDIISYKEDLGCVTYTILCHNDKCNQCLEKTFDIDNISLSRRKSQKLIICPKLNPFKNNKNTSIERYIQSILDSVNVDYVTNSRSILDSGKELDIYIPSKKIAIECNGYYWHSIAYKPQRYHFDKYVECKKQGIELISIWDDQLENKPDIVKSIILSKLGIYKKRIYARQCIIKIIDSNTSNQFLNQYHLQGSIASSVKYGLFYKDELVSVMTFGRDRISKNKDSWELYRYCTKSDVQVIGGPSKLFKRFIKDYSPAQIISFSSNDISNGNLYQKLGFEFQKQTISYWYIKNYNRYHRYTFAKHILIRKGYDQNKTEFQIMEEEGFSRIYDSGQTKWLWH